MNTRKQENTIMNEEIEDAKWKKCRIDLKKVYLDIQLVRESLLFRIKEHKVFSGLMLINI